jgi:ERCC4-type nuclease
MIHVDTNSAEDFLETELRALGLPVVRQRLDVGDIQLSFEDTQLVVERKTWADLAASICDSRWHEQKSRMLAGEGDEARTRYAYLIEGQLLDWERSSGSRMQAKSLWAALLKTQLRDQMYVFHSASKASSVATIAYVFQQLCNGGFCPKAGAAVAGVTSKRKRDNIDTPARACLAMLCVVPGISKAKAEDVVAAYPSMAALMQARESDLSQIVSNKRRLGPVLAHRILRLLRDVDS